MRLESLPAFALALAVAAPGSVRAEDGVGDLPKIKERKVLRALVPGLGEESLPRAGSPLALDRELVAELAGRLGLEVQIIAVGGYDQLIPSLTGGKGDVIVAQLTATEERKKLVEFCRSAEAVAEMLVGKKGAPDLPKTVKDLAGREVHVRASSAYAETLKKLAAKDAPGLKIVAVPETLDTEAIVYDVTRGTRPLTVADSHLLSNIETYNADAVGLFPLAENRPIAWAVRKDSAQLRTAIDGFLTERALTQHLSKTFTTDLDGIKQRGAIRVLTRNNAISYFLFKGEPYGFEYELAKMIAKDLKLRLEIVVPPSHELLIPWLNEGRGDFIAASMTHTPEREAEVAFSRAYLFVDEVLVRKTGVRAELKEPKDLCGQTVHVRKSSSYAQTVDATAKAAGCAITIAPEGEDQETEAILQKVGEGVIPLTVSDSHILDVERTYQKTVEAAFPLSDPKAKKEIAFAIRRTNPQLKQYLDGFVKKNYQGLEYNMAKKRYFENARQISVALNQSDAKSGQSSKYDPVIRSHAKEYNLDWRLLAAQAYAESHFDPEAKSWVGAVGLFQVMPTTGESLGFSNLHDPDQGAHAGIKYDDQLMKQFEPEIEFKQRLRFTLAAYNVGMGHVIDARRLAAELGLDPNKWFKNVETAMLLLEKPEYAKKARHGFCRGSEPVGYVSKIQSSYDEYAKTLPP
jgi:membrane-bound lytic murein transglycosylase F